VKRHCSLALAAIAAGALACSYQVALDDGTYPPCESDGSCRRDGCACLDGRVCVPVAPLGLPGDCWTCQSDEECRVDGPCVQGVCGQDGRCGTKQLTGPCDDGLE